MLVPQSYLFGMDFVCKMKAILNAIFLFCSISKLNYISYFVECVLYIGMEIVGILNRSAATLKFK